MHQFIFKAALAKTLGISLRTLENWVAHRGFPAPRHVSGSRLSFFKVAEVDAWFARELETEATE